MGPPTDPGPSSRARVSKWSVRPWRVRFHKKKQAGWTDNSWGPRAIGIMGPLCPCPNSKKPVKKVQGHLMGPPTDPGPSGSARVSKWSVRPC
ncbi:unnamed protein product, partial [Staurois parvus]